MSDIIEAIKKTKSCQGEGLGSNGGVLCFVNVNHCGKDICPLWHIWYFFDFDQFNCYEIYYWFET